MPLKKKAEIVILWRMKAFIFLFSLPLHVWTNKGSCCRWSHVVPAVSSAPIAFVLSTKIKMEREEAIHYITLKKQKWH